MPRRVWYATPRVATSGSSRVLRWSEATMSDPVIGCCPEHLIGYADAMVRVNDILLGTAHHLARQLDIFFGMCQAR